MQGFNHEISIVRFFSYLFFIAIGFLFFISAFILVVDPYKIWQQGTISGFNAVKLETPISVQMNVAILKSALRKPEVVMMGSSRMRRGFDEIQASKLFGAKVQVIGISGLALPLAKDLLFAISKNTRIKKVFIEISYFTSNACERIVEYAPVEGNPGLALAQLGVEAPLLDSLKTVRINMLGPRAFEGYFNSQGNYLERHDKPISFPQNDYHFKKMTGNCQQHPGNAADFKDLSDIFKFAQANNTEVILLGLPVSPRWQLRVQQAGFAATIMQWKKDLSQHAWQFQVAFRDYEHSTDFPDTNRSDNDLPLFWDETHFSTRIGNHLLAAMVLPDEASPPKHAHAR